MADSVILAPVLANLRGALADSGPSSVNFGEVGRDFGHVWAKSGSSGSSSTNIGGLRARLRPCFGRHRPIRVRVRPCLSEFGQFGLPRVHHAKSAELQHDATFLAACWKKTPRTNQLRRGTPCTWADNCEEGGCTCRTGVSSTPTTTTTPRPDLSRPGPRPVVFHTLRRRAVPLKCATTPRYMYANMSHRRMLSESATMRSVQLRTWAKVATIVAAGRVQGANKSRARRAHDARNHRGTSRVQVVRKQRASRAQALRRSREGRAQVARASRAQVARCAAGALLQRRCSDAAAVRKQAEGKPRANRAQAAWRSRASRVQVARARRAGAAGAAGAAAAPLRRRCCRDAGASGSEAAGGLQEPQLRLLGSALHGLLLGDLRAQRLGLLAPQIEAAPAARSACARAGARIRAPRSCAQEWRNAPHACDAQQVHPGSLPNDPGTTHIRPRIGPSPTPDLEQSTMDPQTTS